MVREVAAEGIASQVCAVFPLGGVRGARARVAQIAVLDLAVESEPLVHGLL